MTGAGHLPQPPVDHRDGPPKRAVAAGFTGRMRDVSGVSDQERQRRQAAVDSAVGSLALSRRTLSAEGRQIAAAYVRGDIDDLGPAVEEMAERHRGQRATPADLRGVLQAVTSTGGPVDGAEQQRRERLVEDVLASQRLEGLTVSREVQELLAAWTRDQGDLQRAEAALVAAYTQP